MGGGRGPSIEAKWGRMQDSLNCEQGMVVVRGQEGMPKGLFSVREAYSLVEGTTGAMGPGK